MATAAFAAACTLVGCGSTVPGTAGAEVSGATGSTAGTTDDVPPLPETTGPVPSTTAPSTTAPPPTAPSTTAPSTTAPPPTSVPIPPAGASTLDRFVTPSGNIACAIASEPEVSVRCDVLERTYDPGPPPPDCLGAC